MKLKFLLLLILFFGLFNFISADSMNVTQADAEICLNNSHEIMNQMINQQFNVQRINDSLNQAELLYAAQIKTNSYKSSGNFLNIFKYCQEIALIQKSAIDAEDSFSALLKFYNISITSDMNSSEVDAIIKTIRDEMSNERYEKVQPLVDQAYSAISNTQASYTAINVIYRNTTRSLRLFFEKNGLSLGIVLALLIIFFIAYRTRIDRWITQRKIDSLEMRKSTIKKLITDLQTGYFHNSNVSEGEYNIKTKKFGEIIRDIDRQIPLLYEQMAKLDPKFKSSPALNKKGELK